MKNHLVMLLLHHHHHDGGGFQRDTSRILLHKSLLVARLLVPFLLFLSIDTSCYCDGLVTVLPLKNSRPSQKNKLFLNSASSSSSSLSFHIIRRPRKITSQDAWMTRKAPSSAVTRLDATSTSSNSMDPSSSPSSSSMSSSFVSGTFHHSAIRTSNITLAMQFYSLFGFEPIVKFKAGPAKAAWLQQQQQQSSSTTSAPPPSLSSSPRIELIEIPAHIVDKGSTSSSPTTKKRAPDLFNRVDLLGHNHIALDVTDSAQQLGCGKNLTQWMDHLNQKSVAIFGKTLRVALQPTKIMVRNVIYELAFIYDADGALIELLCQGNTLPQNVSSGWEFIPDELFRFE